MKKSHAPKIQSLLIEHLMKQGNIELLLPDGVKVEIDITKEGKRGIEISDDYCYVKSSRQDQSVILDTYNISLEYNDNHKKMVCFDQKIDENGKEFKRVEIL